MKKFIVVEGIDQTGKSSAAVKLVELLNVSGVPTVYLKTPDPIFSKTTGIIRAHSSNRAAHFFYHLSMVKFSELKIRRLLKTHCVVCDRYYYSTFGYHVDYESGIMLEQICDTFPEFLFLFITNEEKRLGRANKNPIATSGDKLSKKENGHLERVESFIMGFNPVIIDSSNLSIDDSAIAMFKIITA